MPQYYQIQEFLGIEQQKDSSLLPAGSAYDARNIDASDGNMRVANGFVRHISESIPNNDKILKLLVSRGSDPRFYVVAANNIYAYDSGSWQSIYTFASALTTTQIDYLQTRIGLKDFIIVATGESRMVKIDIASNTATEFGTGLYSFEGEVNAYNAQIRNVTLNAVLSDEAIRHAVTDGIIIGGVLYEVATAVGVTVVLKDTPEVEPTVGATATIRGGGSDSPCNFIDMYYSRLFAAGDPNNPCRLYWSAVVGDGRSIEDWMIVDGSADASGGYVEVGEASGDPIVGIVVLSSQILIFKRYSVYRLYGDRPSTYTLERVENASRPMSNSGAVVKYDTPFYLTMDGISYYDGTGVLPMNNGIRFLRRFLSTVSSVADSKAVHCDNKLYFTCRVNPEESSDDSIIVYDIGRGAFMIRDGFSVSDICVFDGHIYMVNENRYVYEFDVGDSYDGEPIYAYWRTQPTDLGFKHATKHVKEMMFRGVDGVVNVTVRAGNNRAYARRQIFGSADDGFTSVQFRVDKARVFEFLFENEAGGGFGIDGGIDVLWEKENKP